MRVIKLYGILGEKFGRVHRFDVRTPAEAIRALMANFEGFEAFMLNAHEQNLSFRVKTGGTDLEKADEIHQPAGQFISILPSVIGSGGQTKLIVGAVLIATAVYFSGGTLAPYLAQTGIALTLSGVVDLLSPKPKLPEPPERSENKPSYTFNGPVNTTAQGHPVPLAYGRVIAGSAIISGGITVEQIMAGAL